MDALSLSSDALEVVVLPEVGARLHRIRAFGFDLLRTPDREAVHRVDPFFWGAYLMAPWCNRLEARPTRFGSRWIDLPSNFPDGSGSAIHGQVYARPWEVEDGGRLTIHGGGDGWPWRYEVGARVVVSEAELRIELALSNLDNEPMPAGLGIHPWFRKPVQVAIHGGQVLPDNLDPGSQPQPVGDRFDLEVIGDVPDDIDATWTDLTDPAVDFVWPGRVKATLRIEAASAFVVAASPTTLDAVAVEPQTHAPYGLSRLRAREPGGLTTLAPEETLSLVLRFNFEPMPPSRAPLRAG